MHSICGICVISEQALMTHVYSLITSRQYCHMRFITRQEYIMSSLNIDLLLTTSISGVTGTVIVETNPAW